MGCFLQRNTKTNDIEKVFVRESTNKIKMDNGKPVESLLFKKLIGPDTASLTELNLPYNIAASVWMATNTPTFNKLYKGARDVNGEPIFELGNNNKGNYAFFKGENNIDILRVDLKSKRLAYEENTSIVSEATKMEEFKDEPMLPEMIDYLMSFGTSNLTLANQSISAALELVTDADILEQDKKSVDYEAKNFRKNKFGQKERFDPNTGKTLGGTSFNGSNQPQHFTKGFDGSKWDDSLSMGTNLANMFWSRNGNKETDKLMFDGVLMTKQEFIKNKDEKFYKGTDKGTIIHLRNQRQYARNQDEYDALTEKINNTINEANLRGGNLTEKAFSFVEEDNLNDKHLGINKDSVVFFEKIIHAPLMGIHGVIDKIVVRPDGKVTMTEIKSSGYLLDTSGTYSWFDSDIMGDLAVDIEASTLNKAKVQLVLNMMAAGITYPGMRFSLCGIENLANSHQATHNGFIALSKRDVSDIMKMILAFYKNEKEKPDSQFNHIYDQLMALDKNGIRDVYLNPENVDAYVDVVELKYVKKGDKNILVTVDKSEDRLKQLEQRLAKGVGMHADMNRISNFIKMEGKNAGLEEEFDFTEDIKEILAIFSNLGDDPAIFDNDISWANKWIGGTTSNVAHPVVQIYNEYFHAQKLKRDKVALGLRNKYDALFTQAFNAWARMNSVKEFSGTNKFTERFFTSGDATRFWNHFYKEIDLGSYKKTVRLRQDEVTSKEDKELLAFLDDYYASVLDDKYETKQIIKDKDGNDVSIVKKGGFIYDDATFTINNYGKKSIISHLGVYQGKGWKAGNQNNWSWDAVTNVTHDNGNHIQKIPFTPFTSMLPYEFEQKHEWEKDAAGNPIRSPNALVRLKNTFLKHISGFFDRHDNYKGASENRMVELKYMGSESENIANYSMDLGAQFGKFMENIESKRHMDTVLAIAEAISTHAENTLKDKGFNENQINIADWLRKQARWQIKGESPDDDPVANNRALAKELFRIPMAVIDEKTGKYKEYIITLNTLLRGMRTFASYVHMSINPKGSLLNAAQAIFTSLKLGISMQSASTFIGMKKEAVDLKALDYVEGLKMWSQMQESAINGDGKNSKLYLLAKEMSYLPTDYSYFDIQDSFGLNPNSWKNPSGLMVLHSAVEEANSLAILYAQLKSLKIGPKDSITGEQKSAWDMYSVNSDTKVGGQTIHTLVWEDNFNRGLSYQNGAMRPTYGLQPQEVIKMKRIYERMQGNYRHEERSIIEMYILGQVVMQFKRYLPSMIRGQLRGRVSDPSLGRYVEVQKNGETILEWRNRMITGKYILLMNWFFGGVLRPLMNKMPASIGQMKGMTDMGSAKNKYLFAKQLDFKDMSEDEQAMIMDAMITLSSWLAIAMIGLKMEDESGKKDPWYLFLQNVNDTMAQPWNLFKMLDTVKSGLSPVSFNVFINILMGTGEFLHRGFQVGLSYEDSMRNEKGNIPGTKKVMTSLPLMKGFSNTYDLVARRGAKGVDE